MLQYMQQRNKDKIFYRWFVCCLNVHVMACREMNQLSGTLVLNCSHLSVRFFYSGRVRGLIYYHAPQAIEDWDLIHCSKLLLSLIFDLSNTHFLHTGVSIKIEVASSLDRVTNCINKGLVVPLSWGGGRSKHVPPWKILKFQSPKNVIFSVPGAKF